MSAEVLLAVVVWLSVGLAAGMILGGILYGIDSDEPHDR